MDLQRRGTMDGSKGTGRRTDAWYHPEQRGGRARLRDGRGAQAQMAGGSLPCRPGRECSLGWGGTQRTPRRMRWARCGILPVLAAESCAGLRSPCRNTGGSAANRPVPLWGRIVVRQRKVPLCELRPFDYRCALPRYGRAGLRASRKRGRPGDAGAEHCGAAPAFCRLGPAGEPGKHGAVKFGAPWQKVHGRPGGIAYGVSAAAARRCPGGGMRKNIRTADRTVRTGMKEGGRRFSPARCA